MVEYASKLSPPCPFTAGMPRGFVQNVSGQDYFHVQFTQRNAPAGVQYLLQTSTNLLSWNNSPASFSQTGATDNGDGTLLLTLRLLAAIGNALQSFVRIAIQR